MTSSKQSRTERDELHQKEENARQQFVSVKDDLSLLEQQYQKAEDGYRAEAAELSKAKARATQLDEEVRERYACGSVDTRRREPAMTGSDGVNQCVYMCPFDWPQYM